MTILAKLELSPVKGKRYRVTLLNSFDRRLLKIVDFASSEHENFTMHKDVNRRTSYWKRHRGLSKENINNPLSASFWSAWLLWSEPTIPLAKKKIESLFDVKFTS